MLIVCILLALLCTGDLQGPDPIIKFFVRLRGFLFVLFYSPFQVSDTGFHGTIIAIRWHGTPPFHLKLLVNKS